jgi:hypothetical protein
MRSCREREDEGGAFLSTTSSFLTENLGGDGLLSILLFLVLILRLHLIFMGFSKERNKTQQFLFTLSLLKFGAACPVFAESFFCFCS